MNCYDKSLAPLYQKLGIDIKKMFCTMLNVEFNDSQKHLIEKMFAESGAIPYTSSEKDWIKGLVYQEHPHITLLFGSLDSVSPDMISTALSGWIPDQIFIDSIDYFESPDQEEYYCIIAKVDVNDNLMDARSRLELLPHINTFPDYKAHITLGYVQKDPDVLDDLIQRLACWHLKPTEVVYDNNSGDPVSIMKF